MWFAMSRAEKDQLPTAVNGSTRLRSWGSTCYIELGFVYSLFDSVSITCPPYSTSGWFCWRLHGAKGSGQCTRRHNPREMHLRLLPARLALAEQGLHNLHCQRLSTPNLTQKPTARTFLNSNKSAALGFVAPQLSANPSPGNMHCSARCAASHPRCRLCVKFDGR